MTFAEGSILLNTLNILASFSAEMNNLRHTLSGFRLAFLLTVNCEMHLLLEKVGITSHAFVSCIGRNTCPPAGLPKLSGNKSKREACQCHDAVLPEHIPQTASEA